MPIRVSVSVVGLGYIGLPTAAILASKGYTVKGVDTREQVVATINKGEAHIVEPGLGEMVQEVVAAGNLSAYSRPQPADIYLIAVPTPINPDKSPDLSYVFSATESLAPLLKTGDMVILESTSPVGTTEKIAELLSELRPDLVQSNKLQLNVAHCPERVLPGRVIEELVNNDRIIGGITADCARKACAFYKSFVEGECIETDSRTAEMVKLTENSFRDVNIAFANELSMICDRLNINVWDLIKFANRHPRVNILNPGVGVGGHCIAVDPWFIIHEVPENAHLLRTARVVNETKPDYCVEQILEQVRSGTVRSIGCLGLSFKPNIDDLRESPAVEVIHGLSQKYDGVIKVFDPYFKHLPPSLGEAPNVTMVHSVSEISNVDLVVILVGHSLFNSAELLRALSQKRIVDFVNFYQSQNAQNPKLAMERRTVEAI